MLVYICSTSETMNIVSYEERYCIPTYFATTKLLNKSQLHKRSLILFMKRRAVVYFMNKKENSFASFAALFLNICHVNKLH